MNSLPIILIGGLGTTTHYMEHFCGFMHQYIGTLSDSDPIQIYNFPLLHGKTVDEEVAHILSELASSSSLSADCIVTYNIIGFSAGCSVALSLAKHLSTHKIILCNPADIRHRFYAGAVDAIYDYSESLVKTSRFIDSSSCRTVSSSFWFFFFCLLGIIWNLLIRFNMTETTMLLYHQVFGRRNYNSQYTGLQKNTKMFDEPFENIAKTISECVVKPNLTEMMQPWSHLVNKVHVVYGMYDAYITYIIKLKAMWIGTNVLFHELKGAHNMINLNPEMVAQSVYGILY